MNLKKYISLVAVLFIAHFLSFGQVENELALKNDPIVSMLDSLVTINDVIRYNSTIETSSSTNASYFSSLNDEEIKSRLIKINSPIPLTFNQQVKNYIEMYANKKRELTSRVLGLSKLYFPMFEQELDKCGLPLEFKYLSVVESALNPIAVSPVGATGIWQFMYGTGKLYDLNISSYIDDRKDPRSATEAACKYFKEMHDIYNDWLLVIAAYNCGARNVNKAISRSGGKTNFWEISRFLPRETRCYVPAFIAATYVLSYAKELNIMPVTPAFSYYDIDTVTVRSKITFRQLSKILDIPVDVISFLNPTYKRGVVPAGDQTYKLYIPANRIALYVANEDKIAKLSNEELEPNSALADNSAYEWKETKQWFTVRKNETLKQFAHRTDCASSDIKNLNHLKGTKIHKGQRLQVFALVKVKKQKPAEQPVNAVASVIDSEKTGNKDSVASENKNTVTESNPEATAENVIGTSQQDNVAAIEPYTPGKSTETKPKFIFHTVQPGNTLWNIAKRYDGVTVEQIKELNNINSKTKIRVGTKLKLPSNG
jgi:membrane-bound lytic murein transglycosylase D